LKNSINDLDRKTDEGMPKRLFHSMNQKDAEPDGVLGKYGMSMAG
jgi:hypothetical protein